MSDNQYADLDDRYYPPEQHRHDKFEDMLNCSECWLAEAAARKEQDELRAYNDAVLARIEGSIYP